MKKIIKHLINFILLISIFTFVFTLILKTTILNEKYVLKTLDDNYYYNEIYNNIVDNFESNLIQSGIDESISKNLISTNKVKKDIKIVIDGIYNNKKIIIDKEPIKEILSSKIEEVFKGYHRTPNKEEQESIKRLEEKIGEIYEDEIAYKLSSIEDLGTKVYKLNNTATILLIVIGILALILLIVEMFVYKEFLGNIGISIFSSGLIIIIIRLIIGAKYKNILMFNEIFSKIVVAIVNNFLVNILVIGIYLSIIGLILLIIGVYKKFLLNK